MSKDLEVTVLSSCRIVGCGCHSCGFPHRGEVAGQVRTRVGQRVLQAQLIGLDPVGTGEP